ncbi:MAG: AMP-binding enzyme, partial [Gammaproteobacteria bacterium]
GYRLGVERCPQDTKTSIPIGKACSGEELLVLDQQLKPIKNGYTGDLFIRGAGLSPGYWRNEEETARVFLEFQDDKGGRSRMYMTGDLARVGNDGLVYFVGRKDYQIKSRGYRIELGEIEAALNAVESLRECAVISIPSEEFDGVKICCAYVANDGEAITPVKLRTRLSSELPDYMIPSQWRSLSELPKNQAGKIDRRKLAEIW